MNECITMGTMIGGAACLPVVPETNTSMSMHLEHRDEK